MNGTTKAVANDAAIVISERGRRTVRGREEEAAMMEMSPEKVVAIIVSSTSIEVQGVRRKEQTLEKRHEDLLTRPFSFFNTTRHNTQCSDILPRGT